MWIKLSAIALVTATVLALLFLPTTDMTITLDVPRGATDADMDAAMTALPIVVNILSVLVFLAIVAVAAWLSWRVIKHHRVAS